MRVGYRINLYRIMIWRFCSFFYTHWHEMFSYDWCALCRENLFCNIKITNLRKLKLHIRVAFWKSVCLVILLIQPIEYIFNIIIMKICYWKYNKNRGGWKGLSHINTNRQNSKQRQWKASPFGRIQCCALERFMELHWLLNFF